jgi:hypothetical protein
MKQHVLLVEVKKGETLKIGEHIAIRLEEKSGQRARLRFVFKEPTEVRRETQTPGQTAPA